MTPRPLMRRRIRFRPDIDYFGPAGKVGIEEIGLTLPELEAIRLKDLEAKDQKECAKQMKVSQPTFSRILDNAHKKIASALVEGRGIKIEGGEYTMVRPRGGRFRAGAGGRGRMGGIASGPGGSCICPKCNSRYPHQIGVPCYQRICNKCGTKLVRE